MATLKGSLEPTSEKKKSRRISRTFPNRGSTLFLPSFKQSPGPKLENCTGLYNKTSMDFSAGVHEVICTGKYQY